VLLVYLLPIYPCLLQPPVSDHYHSTPLHIEYVYSIPSNMCSIYHCMWYKK